MNSRNVALGDLGLDPRLLTVGQAAHIAGTSVREIRARIKSGELFAFTAEEKRFVGLRDIEILFERGHSRASAAASHPWYFSDDPTKLEIESFALARRLFDIRSADTFFTTASEMIASYSDRIIKIYSLGLSSSALQSDKPGRSESSDAENLEARTRAISEQEQAAETRKIQASQQEKAAVLGNFAWFAGGHTAFLDALDAKPVTEDNSTVVVPTDVGNPTNDAPRTVKTSGRLLQKASKRADKELIRVRELAELFGCSGRTVRRMLADRKLGYIRLGGQIRIERVEVERYIAENKAPSRRG
jgi:excisionase family DNA binding protein